MALGFPHSSQYIYIYTHTLKIYIPKEYHIEYKLYIYIYLYQHNIHTAIHPSQKLPELSSYTPDICHLPSPQYRVLGPQSDRSLCGDPGLRFEQEDFTNPMGISWRFKGDFMGFHGGLRVI